MRFSICMPLSDRCHHGQHGGGRVGEQWSETLNLPVCTQFYNQTVRHFVGVARTSQVAPHTLISCVARQNVMATTISMQTQIVGGPGDRRRDGQIAASCVYIYISARAPRFSNGKAELHGPIALFESTKIKVCDSASQCE